MAQLVFVHGRSQEFKDAGALKGEWIRALREGLARSGKQLPISEDDVRFPYYGQALYDLVAGVPDDQVAKVQLRGVEDKEELAFLASVIEEIGKKAGVTEEEIVAEGGPVAQRGVLNSERLQAVLTVIDRRVPFASGANIALFTRDVYQYLRNPVFASTVDEGVRSAITPGVPTVVVGHSLGSVVAYKVLRDGSSAGQWDVPLFVTVGSPLAVTMIKKALRPLQHPKCAKKWFNAMDNRDVVALYPLNGKNFPIKPAIENVTNIDNQTENRHGIKGYLNDKVVAKRIFDALTS